MHFYRVFSWQNFKFGAETSQLVTSYSHWFTEIRYISFIFSFGKNLPNSIILLPTNEDFRPGRLA